MRADAADRRRDRASTTSSSSATRSCCTTRWRRSRRTRVGPTRSGGSRRTSAVTPTSGPAKLTRARRRRSRRPAGRGCASGSSSCVARLFGTRGRRRPRQGARGRRGGALRRPGRSPEVAAIAADEREHAEIWDRLKAGERRRGRPTRHATASAHRRAARRQRRGDRRARAVAPDRRPVGDAAGGHLRRSATGWSATSRWSWASPAPPSDNPSFILLAGIAGPARRGVQHGRRRVHLDAEPARAVRAPDRARARRDGGDARGGGGRARGRLPRQGLHAGRGRPDRAPDLRRTRRRRSTRSSARSSASTPTSSARRGAPPAARSWRSRSARSIPVIPYLFGGGTAALAGRASGSASSRCSRSGAAVSLLTGRGLIFSGVRQLGDRPRGGGRHLRDRLASSACRRPA